MKKTYNLQQGITITIDKNIPVSAGLAGGSTDLCGNNERDESPL